MIMSGTIKTLVMALIVVTALSGCQNANNDVRESARQALENPNAVQPANNSALASAIEQPALPSGPVTQMEFAEQRFNFGTVVEGEKVTHVYTFKNTGKEPLILSNARGSCGCTVPQWPREPIAPGDTGEIKVEFNTANKRGQRSQKVTLTANTNPPETFLYLEGEVTAPATTSGVNVN